MNFGKISTFGLGICLGLASCKEERPETIIPEPDEPVLTTQQSIEMSQNWAKDESFKIDQFVDRHGWPVVTSGTGVRYYIYEDIEGENAKAGQVAIVDYNIRLLDADTTLCYTSAGGDPQDFLIEMDNVETGLHEAITYLSPGDKAFIVLPHYLAHGLLGDNDKIPPLSSVLYEIHLLGLK